MGKEKDYIEELWTLALASRLRRLLNRFLADGEKVYRNLGLDFKVKWFPVLHLLVNHSPMILTDIAAALGMAHPSIIEVTDDMIKRGLLISQKSRSDRRKREFRLSKKGGRMCDKLKPVWIAFRRAGDEITNEFDNNFMESIKKMEMAMDRQSMYERIMVHIKR